ncbi:hypothetical protein HLK59_42925 [Streptomyces sp. S3(2020)]|uniref:hypothetical protein n=1 Tax=Streptomyces sp. S3(2020) TaxID=2732044 RepID=UPI001487A594|nr:hypothetical protein [Streptomyces sp. S3(2020)]NNN36990.1 hypothetical protein [Streptomyces sp. S3(2020)]
MSTGLIIALIVIVAAVIAVAAVLARRTGGPRRGRSLKRRFGPEYDRVVARHDGDPQAAERELAERVERHGSLRERPLEPAQRQQYEARWTAAQERFVDSPREAVAEADRLLADLAGAKGFPDGGQYDEQLAALSVHHADHVHGYRRVHHAARPGGKESAGTEEMREAMVEARSLFEDLVGHNGHDGHSGRHEESDGGSRPARTDSRGHLPWASTRRHAKGS